VGAVVDTTVFVDIEREARRLGVANPGTLIGESLERCLGPDEEAAMSAITASELLHGVHRATAEHRARRETFVEAVISAVPCLEFGLLAARAHARLWAHLSAEGADMGAHDRVIAATALSLGWRVATANARHFRRVPGLQVVEVQTAW
jgi:predicted nucleic acid-binding protein